MGRYTSSLAVGHETDLCRAHCVSILELLLRVGMYTTAAVLAAIVSRTFRPETDKAAPPHHIIYNIIMPPPPRYTYVHFWVVLNNALHDRKYSRHFVMRYSILSIIIILYTYYTGGN